MASFMVNFASEVGQFRIFYRRPPHETRWATHTSKKLQPQGIYEKYTGRNHSVYDYYINDNMGQWIILLTTFLSAHFYCATTYTAATAIHQEPKHSHTVGVTRFLYTLVRLTSAYNSVLESVAEKWVLKVGARQHQNPVWG